MKIPKIKVEPNSSDSIRTLKIIKQNSGFLKIPLLNRLKNHRREISIDSFNSINTQNSDQSVQTVRTINSNHSNNSIKS